MLHSIAKIYSVLFMFLSVFISKINLSKKQFCVLWWLFVLSLSTMTYNVTPQNDWDLIGHFVLFDQIRGSQISIFNFIFNNSNFIGGYAYKDLITFNILRYIGVHLSNNNFLIPALCVFIDYSILGYIITDWTKEDKGNYGLNLLTLLLSFTCMPYIHASSGMRNALCASIMGLAVYLYLYKRKGLFLFIFLSFMAITVHPAAIITIPFVFLAKINIGLIAYLAIFVISSITVSIAQRLAYSQIPFLSLIGQKYLSYTSDSLYIGSRAPLYGVLTVTAVFLLIYFLFYKRFNKSENESEKKIIFNFLAIYMIYIWGNVNYYDMVLRPAYVFGTLSPVLVTFLTDKNIWSTKGVNGKIEKFVSTGATFSCVILCAYVNYKLRYNGF